MDEYKGSKSSLIADVDCTTEGKELCEKNDVRGYPSIKYGDPDDLKDYQGGRDLTALRKFAEENLGPQCGPDNLDLCNEETKAVIEKLQKMTVEELDKAIADADKEVEKITAKATKAIDGMQAKIKALSKDKEKETKKREDTVAKENKKLGLSLKRKVSSAKKKAEEGGKKKKKDKKAKKKTS